MDQQKTFSHKKKKTNPNSNNRKLNSKDKKIFNVGESNRLQSTKKRINLIEWDINDSIFKEYQGDSTELLDSCFEFDWNCSKVQI